MPAACFTFSGLFDLSADIIITHKSSTCTGRPRATFFHTCRLALSTVTFDDQVLKPDPA
jgi:hypothetical protein